MQPIKHKLKWISLLAGLLMAITSIAFAATDISKPAVLAEVLEILLIEADPEYGEYLAGECSSCHNPSASKESSVPKIHGASKESIIQNLLEFKSGERNNTTMKGVAEKFSQEEIAALAVYLAEYEFK